MLLRQNVFGFAISLVVGMVLSILVTAVLVLRELPHELDAEASDPVDLRRMIVGAVAFAIACAISRAFVLRRSARRVRA